MMGAAVVVIALCWLGIGVAAVVRWLLADDRHTVQGYRDGLGALGGVTAHTGSRDPDEVPATAAAGHVRVLSADESSQLPARPRRRSRSVVPTTRRRRRRTSPHASRMRPAADVGPAQRVVVTTPDVVIGTSDVATADGDVEATVVRAPARTPRTPIRVLDAGRRRRMRPGPVAVVAALVVVAGVVVVRARGPHPASAAAATHGAAAVATPTTVAPPAPTTTAPPAAHLAVTQLNGIPGELAVVLPAADVALGIDATQPCWAEVRNGDRHGSVLFSGMIEPGQPLHLTTANPAWIRLGNPVGVTLDLNGASLTVPGDTPVDLSIQPGTAS